MSVQAEISRLDPHMVSGKTGTLGRLADALSKDYSVNTFAVDTSLLALEGNKRDVQKTALNSEVGFHKFNPSAAEDDVINSQFDFINGEQESISNLFGQTWSSSLVSAINNDIKLYLSRISFFLVV